MNKIFEQVGISPNVARSSFDHGHENKLTFNYGEIIPSLCYQLIPGDSGKISVESLLRQQTMIAPIMQRSNVSHHFFKVPMRLLDSNFKQKRTRWNKITNETLDIDAPYITIRDLARIWVTKDFFTASHHDLQELNRYCCIVNNFYDDISALKNDLTPSGGVSVDDFHCILSYSGTILDYLGIPCGPHYQGGINVTDDAYYCAVLFTNPQQGNDLDHLSLYPILAYNLVYMSWFRDQNLEPDWLHGILETMSRSSIDNPHFVPFDHDDIAVELFTTKLRAYSKDYFTSMLPRTVKSTEFPDGISAPVVNGGVSIEGLRIANAMQQWLERDNRGGSRYPEWLLSHFGVTSSYGLLDYPEFLGGFSSPLAVSEVTQNSATNDVSPQGNLAGKSTNYDNSSVLSYYSEEDSYLFCFTSVLPKQGYSQGISKNFTRIDFVDDYYMPEFANLGEQVVRRKELQGVFGTFKLFIKKVSDIADRNNPNVVISFDNRDVAGDAVLYIDAPNFEFNDQQLGYQSRYSDYKFSFDEIHGEFRNNLDYWHMSRIFKYVQDGVLDGGLESLKAFVKNNYSNTDRVIDVTLPIALNDDLIKCRPMDVDRVFAIRHDVSAQIKMQIFFSHYAVRRMPEFPIPHL